MGNINVAGFFRDLLVQDAGVSLMVCYDSMSSESVVASQSSAVRAIADSWDLPRRSDGSPAWCGFGTNGMRFTTDASRLFMTINSGGTGVWSTTGNAGRIPGGVSPGGTTAGGPTTVTGSTGGDSAVAPQPYTDWSVTGSSRTAWNGTITGTGVASAIVAGTNNHASTTTIGPQGWYWGDPFNSRQTIIRDIWYGATGGATDMRTQAFRQVHDQNTLTAANTTLVGSPSAAINHAAAGVTTTDTDCGAGPGSPGRLLVNPTSPTGTTMRMYSIGFRAFRSSGGSPIVGAHLAVVASPGTYAQQHASCMGKAGMVASLPNAYEQGPDPYFSAANARTYMTALCGFSGNPYATHIIIYDGHNRTSTENSELAVGISATHKTNVKAIIDQHVANAAAVGAAAPKFLIVRGGKMLDSYTPSYARRAIHLNIGLTLEQTALEAGSNVSYIDMFAETDDGDTTFAYGMWYSRAAGSVGTVATGSSGPTLTGADAVHHSVVGAEKFWGKVWQIGMVACNKATGIVMRGTRPSDYPSKRRRVFGIR